MDTTKCAKCDFETPDDMFTDEQGNRRPCPKCGAVARKISTVISESAVLSSSFTCSVTTYPDRLLTIADDLVSNGNYGIAVVVAHMACEVATERAMSNAFAKKQVQYLEDSVTNLLNGYNLGNNRHRKLYTALTGDAIETSIFWSDFKLSAERRNKIIHNGAIANQSEAISSVVACRLFVSHVHP